MSTEEERIARIVASFGEFAKISGSMETTRIVPNCEVVDAAPTGLTDYIIVENELGFNVPAVKVPDITYTNGDKVNLLYIEGTEPIAFQHGTISSTGGYPGALPLTTKGDIVTRDASQNIRLGIGSNGLALIADSNQTSGLKYGLPGIAVKNTSGATVNAGDVGYIDHAGEFKTTTTASDIVAWAVVDIGGANNTVISVLKRGRRLVNYTGSAPSQGQYLVTSTSIGLAQAQSFMSPAVFAVCMAAGSGGTVDAILLTNRELFLQTNAQFVYGTLTVSDSDFVATIATLPGGATLTYNNPTSGAEDSIEPWAALGTFNSKLVLHNTTRGTSLLISSVTIGTNTIVFTTNIPGAWQVGDTITCRSQTNTNTFLTTAYYYEFDLSGMTAKPGLAVALIMLSSIEDSSTTVSAKLSLHPFESFVSSKNFQSWTQLQNAIRFLADKIIPVSQNKFTMAWKASGSSTMTLFFQHIGWIVAAP